MYTVPKYILLGTVNTVMSKKKRGKIEANLIKMFQQGFFAKMASFAQPTFFLRLAKHISHFKRFYIKFHCGFTQFFLCQTAVNLTKQKYKLAYIYYIYI